MMLKSYRINLFDFFLILAVVCQVSLLLIAAINPSDQVNYVVYILNYIIGFLIIITLVAKGLVKHFLAIVYFCCYMLFLMAQKPFEADYNVYLTFAWVKLDASQYRIFATILFFGLIVTFFSYLCFSYRQARPLHVSWIEQKDRNHSALRTVLAVLLVVSLPLAIYMQSYVAIIRSRMEYTTGYLINVDVPAFIKVGYYIYSSVILLFLAAKPKKGFLYFALLTYILIEGGVQLVQGRRALLAATLIFCIWYLIKYYDVKRIDAKLILKLTTAVLVLLSVFILVEQARDHSVRHLSLQSLRRFFISNGGSDSVIANTIYRKDAFPESGIVYLLDPFINNPIGNILLRKQSVPQGLKYLELHHSFSHWLSFLTESSLYLSGHGMGSSFLAELYLAFGLIGPFLGSAIVGWIIDALNKLDFKDNIFKTALGFFLVRRLFTLPRDSMFSWVGSVVYLLFVILLVLPFAYIPGLPKCKKNQNTAI